MDEKKLLKNVMEKETTARRLQSLKLPRDLSLGLSKPKKQYTPNLNVVRNKDKPKEILKKNDQKRKEKTFRGRTDRNDDNKERYRQSTGVFSQGSAELKRVSTNMDRRVSFRETTKTTTSTTTLSENHKDIPKIKAEDAILEDFANFGIDSDEETSTFKPLVFSKESEIKNSLSSKMKIDDQELKVSESYQNLIAEPFNNNVAYSDENSAISLVKLPDSFAGKGFSDDPNVKELCDYPLKRMPEGQIGKLVIRKSGKMEVHIGSIKYELSEEFASESKEELVTIMSDDSSEKANIAVLGNILNNFVMRPDYDAMLDGI